MGNTQAKPHPRTRDKKQVRWKAADRPSPPGRPRLAPDADFSPDLVTICWTKPARDGGSSITGYLVEHRRTGSSLWSRSSPLMVLFPELSISGLEPGWRYQFRVSAENAVGLSDPSEPSEPLAVALQRSTIAAPKFFEELQDTTALENEKAEFVVHFVGQPPPKICWFKDGFEVFSSRRMRILTEADKSILTIHQSALADEGEIKCTATNKAGHASTKARLSLEAPPSIRLPRQYEDGLLFEIGEVIRLKVSVAGRPTPLVFWSHDGESIQENERYEIEYSDRSSILKINEAHRTDRGEYQIKAVNRLGECNASFLITVTDKPSPPGRARVVMTLGRSVTLMWSTPNDDGGCKIGNYIVEYYRLGWNMWLKAATSRQLSTILGDLIEGSEYKFRIKAESPYGISEPGEESEIIFIPDPKRGIVTPQIRSRSQPRDIMEEVVSPIAARRKPKPRSQSSTRAETSMFASEIENAGIPKRPERTKIKSPSITPQPSPRVARRETQPINQNIFDRASIVRDLAYGSPDLKMKKMDTNLSNGRISSSSEISESSNPPKPERKSRSPSPQKMIEIETPKSPPPQTSKQPRENNENFTGSSEFMLVLYPDGNEQDHRRTSEDITFDFNDNSIPPPLSLSAPELGMEPPIFGLLKSSASSTELLHERAMMRFNEAAAAEEAELEKRRNAQHSRISSLSIPKIQINSRDDQEIVGLERSNSYRRRYSAGSITQQQLWAQRRYSLKNSHDLNSFEKKNYIRQLSDDKEDTESQKKLKNQPSLEGHSSIEEWNESEESYSEEESEEETDDDEDKPMETIYSDEEGEEEEQEASEDEEETYHPPIHNHPTDNQPFEILTKRNKLPDPNFVPKPILKKSDGEKSPQPQKRFNKFEESLIEDLIDVRHQQKILPPQRPRSYSVAQPAKTNSLPNQPSPRQRSLSLVPNQDQPARGRSNSLVNELIHTMNKPTEPVAPGHDVSVIAQISAITAASIVIPKPLLNKKKDEEEVKVVADHYGDIIRNVSKKRRDSIPTDYLEKLRPKVENVEKPISKFAVPSDQPVIIQKDEPSPRRNSLIIEQTYEVTKTQAISQKNTSPRRDSLTSNESRKNSLTIEDAITYRFQDDPKEKSPSPARYSSGSSGSIPHIRQQKSPKRSLRRPSVSPVRAENWSGRSRTSSIDSRVSSRKKTPSPLPPAKPRRPMLREIMTQTSIGLEMNRDSQQKSLRELKLETTAQIQVRSFMDYVTDLAMFLVACWFYLFSNELLAIPILLIMVCRQLKDEFRKRIPKWIMKRINKKK